MGTNSDIDNGEISLGTREFLQRQSDLRKVISDNKLKNPILEKASAIHPFWISDENIGVYIFLKKNVDLENLKEEDKKYIFLLLKKEISEYLSVEEENINFRVIYDSDENVEEDFEGSYYLRMQ